MRLSWASNDLRRLTRKSKSYCLQSTLLLYISSILVGPTNGAEASSAGFSFGYDQLVEKYVPEFLGVDRSIIGRQSDDIQPLTNNEPGKLNINGGDSQYWTFSQQSLSSTKSPVPPQLPSQFGTCPEDSSDDDDSDDSKSRAELKTRQGGTTLYVSINTCNQPVSSSSTTTSAPGQLQLFISTSSSNQKPSSSQHDYAVTLNEGYGAWNLSVQSDIFFGVSAPSANGFSGSYNYELTASIDDFYAKYNDSVNSYFVDSDNGSALIFTNDTTTCNSSTAVFQEWMNATNPFGIFVQNQNNPSIQGLQNSMCALKGLAQVSGLGNIDTGMTTTGGGKPKQQFHVKTLNSTSAYYAMVTLGGSNGNGSFAGPGKVNGGGTVWNSVNFTTKSAPNCALIYGLDFCKDVAYAVPANPAKISDTPSLRGFYDSFASTAFTNFSKSIAQIPCNTTSSAQYSLAVNCTNCTTAYKDWLCAVTIPRCEDFSNEAPYLLPRAVNQSFINATYGAQFTDDPALSAANKSFAPLASSRNPLIDSGIIPGPYKELLPCEDLCYRLVRSCPAALQFTCPLDGHGLNYTYGTKWTGLGPGQVSCNDPSVDHNSGNSLGGSILLAICLASLSTFIVFLV